MKNTLAFSLRALRRDWRAGELRILVVALVIAVASMTAVGFFIMPGNGPRPPKNISTWPFWLNIWTLDQPESAT